MDNKFSVRELYKKYTEIIRYGDDGRIEEMKITAPDTFNFAYDVIDLIAENEPDRLSMLWVNDRGVEKRITFKELKETTDKLAAALMNRGITRGTPVILLLKRHYTYWYSYLALHKIGAIAIPATTMLQVKDISYRIKAADIKAVIATSEGEITSLFDTAEKECGAKLLKIITGAEKDGWLNLDTLIDTAPEFERPTGLKASDISLLFFTSGTTGMPKMVIHDYYYPLGHIPTAVLWHNVKDSGLHLTVADTGWAKTAWGKMYSQWMAGSAFFIYDHEKFNAKEMLEVIAKHKVTTFCAPPTIYRFFIQEDLSKYDLSALKYITTAGEALNPEVYNKVYEATGLKLMEGYGQTECVLITINQPQDTPKPGSMGRPNPVIKTDIVDDGGNSAAAGVNGEIVIMADPNNRYPGMFIEYYKDKELTGSSWNNGVYHTGDIAWKDEDGYYWFVGRKDDIIKSSGYRIGPFEVESVIMEHPAVVECAVVGEPDPIRGQVIKAFIVLTANYQKSEDLKKEIQNYVKSHTAPYKYPRIVEFVDSLPKTISGKIRRVEIKKN